MTSQSPDKAKPKSNKKIHKNSRFNSKLYGWVVRPVCKVDNKTYAYTASTDWQKVTCLKCLEYK